MPSPFPGMDPYLEGYLWSDFQQDFASAIRQYLTPKLRPTYVARLAVRMIQDPNPEAEVGIMYPDVEVLAQKPKSSSSPYPTIGTGGITTISPSISPALSIPMIGYEVRLVNVEIRDAKSNQLVTSIEILSPVNKRGKYLREYRQKRERLAAAGVHILEIDLLRRGRRPVRTSHVTYSKDLADIHYLISLLRRGSSKLEAWPLLVTDPLPVVSLPLREPDADLALDLPACFADVYENAAYDLSIDYTEVPPPPLFDAETAQWIDTLLQDYRTSAADG